MLGNYKIAMGVMLGAVLFSGCVMNDKAKLQPDKHLEQAWNEDLNKTDALQRWLYHTNQFFVTDGITFHDNVQKDMGLQPSGVWYPTYEMADGEVPFQPEQYPNFYDNYYPEGSAMNPAPQPDPAKVDSDVEYSAPAPALMTPAPAASGTSGDIDYQLLQRGIKRE